MVGCNGMEFNAFYNLEGKRPELSEGVTVTKRRTFSQIALVDWV